MDLPRAARGAGRRRIEVHNMVLARFMREEGPTLGWSAGNRV
jgi:hypothetical protein